MAIRRLRAVFDTNVYVSAALSKNSTSPTLELIARWQRGEFELLISDGIVEELADKLSERHADPQTAAELISSLTLLAEFVRVTDADITPAIAADPDDDIVLACAVVGKADYLVTYDPHFDALGEIYRGIAITKALPFLWAVRGGSKPV